MRQLPELLRSDHNFRRFLVSRSVDGSRLDGLRLRHRRRGATLAHPDSTVGLYTAALMVGQMTGNIAFGFLADRLGHKLCMELGMLSSFLGFALALAAPVAELYFLVFVLLGIGSAAVMVSGILIVLEFCEPERRPTYIGITNTGVGLIGIVAPLVGAVLAATGTAGCSLSAALVLAAGLGAHALVGERPAWAEAAVAPDKENSQP